MRKFRFSPAVRSTLYEAYDKRCLICEEILSFGDMHIHHVLKEVLVTNKKEFKQIVKLLGLPADFEINSYLNWGPCHPRCHKKLHKALFNPNYIGMLLANIAMKQAVIKKIEARIIANSKEEKGSVHIQRKSVKYYKLHASKVANFVKDRLYEVHRGAILLEHGITAIFGNDGYEAVADDRAKRESAQLRTALEGHNIKELGFGLSSDRYSWCVLAKTENVEYWSGLVWLFYPKGSSNNSYQQSIGYVNLQSYWETPLMSHFKSI